MSKIKLVQSKCHKQSIAGNVKILYFRDKLKQWFNALYIQTEDTDDNILENVKLSTKKIIHTTNKKIGYFGLKNDHSKQIYYVVTKHY